MAMTVGLERNPFFPTPTPFNIPREEEHTPFSSSFGSQAGSTALSTAAFADPEPFSKAAFAIASFALPILGDIFGGGPSANWLSFAPRLEGTLTGARSAASNFLNSIFSAKTPQNLESARQTFLGGVEGSGVGGFASRGMPPGWVVPELPGATGTSHEGGLLWNPNAFNSYLNQLYSGTLTALQSPNKFDLKAFQNAAMPLLQQAIQAPGGNTFGDMPGLGPATATPGVEGATYWNPLFMGPVQREPVPPVPGEPVAPQGGMNVGRTGRLGRAA